MAETKGISRRQFVGSAAAVAAVSSLAGKSVLAAASAKGSTLASSTLRDDSNWKEQGVENLAKSPHAKLHDIPVHAVTIQSGFWARRREINVTKSIPSMHDLLEANGRMNNFRRLVGKSKAQQIGPVFSDSDVYKWTEAVGFALVRRGAPVGKRRVVVLRESRSTEAHDCYGHKSDAMQIHDEPPAFSELNLLPGAPLP